MAVAKTDEPAFQIRRVVKARKAVMGGDIAQGAGAGFADRDHRRAPAVAAATAAARRQARSVHWLKVNAVAPDFAPMTPRGPPSQGALEQRREAGRVDIGHEKNSRGAAASVAKAQTVTAPRLSRRCQVPSVIALPAQAGRVSAKSPNRRAGRPGSDGAGGGDTQMDETGLGPREQGANGASVTPPSPMVSSLHASIF